MHHPPACIDAADVSATLLALYAMARQPSVHQFQKDAIECLGTRVQFDSVFWGSGTLFEGRSHVHSAYVFNMPPDVVDLLNLTEQSNIVARTCSGRPGVAHRFHAAELFANAETALLANHQGIRQVCCIATVDTASGLVGFLSLARHQDEPAFGERECAWLALLMPHLNTMLNLTRVAQMHQIHSARAPRHTRMAVTDAKGVLHVMEPGFHTLLREEWPDWQGPLLPPALIGPLAADPHRHAGRHIIGETSGVAEQLLVTLARKGPTDRLTPTERAAAEAYAAGHSYKEVAQQLGMAPATVRHHLREVYAKLEVGDKAALAGRLRSRGPSDQA